MFSLLSVSATLHAVTIDEIAARNNKIIELDQEIAIAEKNKRLTEIRSSVLQPETIALPRTAAARRNESLAVLSVHGVPGNPIVDIQYGETVLQKKLGEATPDGWQISVIAHDSVTFRRKVGRKPDLIKTLGIGFGSKPDASHAGVAGSVPVPVPSTAGSPAAYPGT